MTELVVEDDQEPSQSLDQQEDQSKMEPAIVNSYPNVLESIPDISHEQVDGALRREAYSWPRLVFPPLKRSKHVILDSCTAEGKITHSSYVRLRD